MTFELSVLDQLIQRVLFKQKVHLMDSIVGSPKKLKLCYQFTLHTSVATSPLVWRRNLSIKLF